MVRNSSLAEDISDTDVVGYFTLNDEVAGSSPAHATIKIKLRGSSSGRARKNTHSNFVPKLILRSRLEMK